MTIWWDEKTRIIGIDWKDTTAAMTGEQFKMELTLFASHVENQKARGILVDVTRFRHKLPRKSRLLFSSSDHAHYFRGEGEQDRATA